MGRLRDRMVLLPGLVYDRHAYGKGPGRDPELLVRGVEPPSDLEKKGMQLFDDVEEEIFHHKMTSVVEEAREVYQALSISEGIITGDMNASIFTSEGDPAVVATGIYFHTLLNYAQAKYILKYYRPDPTVGLRDGDIFFFNDPTCGGVHTFDMFVTAPIFYEDLLVGWAEVGGHQGECGSISPGGFSPTATTRWEEGLHVHALRIGEHWQLRRDIFDFFLNSVRNPFVFAADLKARVATCKRIRDRVMRECQRRGPVAVMGGLRRILDTSAKLARKRLSLVPDGIYRAILFNDGVGTDEGLVRVPTTVIKEEDHMTVLVQGVSPENFKGPQHSTWHLVKASTGVYLFTYFFRGLAPNIGLLEPVEFLVEGPSIANCTEEVAHGEGTTIAAMVVQNLHVIGSKMLFSSPENLGVCAPFSRNVFINVYAGTNIYGYRTANFTGPQNGGGQGARFDMDGEHGCGFFWASVTDIGEVEESDTRLPLVTLARTTDKDFHGFGKYRGGTPCMEVSMAPPAGCLVTTRGASDRLSHNPGLFGGYAGPPNPRFIIQDTNLVELMQNSDPRLVFRQYELAKDHVIAGRYRFESSSQPTEPFQHGDVFVYSVGGGGGYGDVLERDPEAVMEDVRTNVLSIEMARDLYGVVFDPATLSVDTEATVTRRQAMRVERLQKGKPFAEFMEEWSQSQPSPEILKYYGDWPEPRVKGYRKPFWGLYDDPTPRRE
ncbi:MAG: hydantoinase B/oxoprolinase family protein [Firmicutes bacterium]|nr:hydantoinase B/oxoprolinase family protein [Bacillota bacterium]